MFCNEDEFKKDPFPNKCNCLPACTEIWYSTEVSMGSFPGEGFFQLGIADRIEEINHLKLKSHLIMDKYFKLVVTH